MDEADALRGLEAARRLAAMSPQTQATMATWDFDDDPPGSWAPSAFRSIGRAIGSKRHPIGDKHLKRLFAEIERLLGSPDFHIANAVATNLLEEVWRAARHSGFDLSVVDPHLGAQARGYLVSWDEFNGAQTPGLRRR